MAANTVPIYSVTPHIDSGQNNQSGTIIGPTANTAQDGTGTAMYQIFVAGANGSYVQKIIFKSVVSPAATVARLFLCNNTGGSYTAGTTNTATNNMFFGEISLPLQTQSQTVASATLEYLINFAIPASYRILVSFGTSTGSTGTGYSVVVIAGDY